MTCRTIALLLILALGIFVAPLAANAQPAGKVHRIGRLSALSAADGNPFLEAFRQGLRELGYVVWATPEGVVHLYHGRGIAEPWMQEGKYALKWTRLSCHRFVANQVRLQLFILAYNLGNFLRRLTRPKVVKEWSLPSVQLKLIKAGAGLVRHARRLVLQMAEVAAPRDVWMAILERIGGLRLVPG